MQAAAFHQYLFNQLDRIRESDELSTGDQLRALRSLLIRLFELATHGEQIQFSTLYARMAYVAHRYNFPPELTYRLQQTRYASLEDQASLEESQKVNIGLQAIAKATQLCFPQDILPNWKELLEAPFPIPYEEAKVVGQFEQLRLLVVDKEAGTKVLVLREEKRPDRSYRLQFDNGEQEEPVLKAIHLMLKVAPFPVLVNLLGVEILDNGGLKPTQLILYPDYLIDVTAVANSFGGGAPQAWGAISRKLLPFEQRPALMTGNIVNHFLDVLMSNPETNFQELKQLIFQTQPLALCCLTDREVIQMVSGLQKHYLTLKQLCKTGLEQAGIDRRNCLLEPSFYSPAYGLQGRLDVLHRSQSDQGPLTSIIELKSGKIYRPNLHGLSQSHFIQTLLYDLMINQAFGQEANVASYILYSQAETRPLRFAPPETFQQQEALSIRNQILAIELLLTQLVPGAELLAKTNRLIAALVPAKHKGLARFTLQDFQRVVNGYDQLSSLERRYFGAFMGFTAREQMLAKMGEAASDQRNGLASLWVESPQDKEERFDALGGLRFQHYDAKSGNLSLMRRADADQMVKFRKGDIVALYANDSYPGQQEDALHSQVFKCTIVEINPRQVILRLRSHQLNEQCFNKPAFWTIERDVLDASFGNYYRGLWAWVESDRAVRNRWLGLAPPGQQEVQALPTVEGLTTEQHRILEKILSGPDYFLLWGPPGTGKTSVMLHQLVAHLLEQSDEHLLLLAYTNRAVDEICESIERIGGGFRDYLRIGSSFGTAEQFQDRLLRNRSQAMNTRAELLNMLAENRIVVGTVASLGGKDELFRLKQFDRIIVDEASQILEPLLIGLLSRAPKALLIGDHRQLPAVVQQPEIQQKVEDADLREIGLFSLGISLFERLYYLARHNNWHWAFDQLSYQGRMHESIMAFPAKEFYQGQLFVLPPETGPRSAEQKADLQLDAGVLNKEALSILSRQRLCFFDSPIDRSSTDNKVNRHEAQLILELIAAFEQLYAGTDQPISVGDIGIITPYRAQIAHIRKTISAAGRVADDYTVDTVERYQGGARRIILISLCVNDALQLESLAQLDREAVDRKLNVAMTRAREHLVIVGCADLLRRASQYEKLLNFIAD